MQEVQLGRLKGRYCVYWKDPRTGKRRRYRLKAATLSAARAEALEMYNWIVSRSPEDLRLRDLWDAYKQALEGRRTGRQLGEAGKTIGSYFADYTPDAINDKEVKKYIKWRRESSLRRRGEEISDGTLHSEINLLQSTLNFGVKKRLIKSAVHLDNVTKPAPKERWLTNDEIARLFKETRKTPHLHVATVLMLSTAGRVTAVLELTWDRVNFEEGYVDLRIDPKKPAKGRAKVPMNRGLRTTLEEWRPNALTEFVVEHKGSGVASISKAFRNAAARAGFTDVTPHVLRHTSAVHMVAAGRPMEKVSQYLGHSSISVTRRIYARFAPEHLKEEAESVDFIDVDVSP